MRPQTGSVLVGLCMLAACSSSHDDGPEACAIPYTYRCNGAVLQSCLDGWCSGGVCVGPVWSTIDTCIAPKVCKTGTNPEIPSILQNGCYDSGSSCSEEGLATCNQISPPLPVGLWTCSRRSQDGSLQWSLARCDQQSPSAICLPDSHWLGGPLLTACYEVAGTCPPSSQHATRCEGNAVYFCSGPTIVDGKAVLDWVASVDCTLTGLVCRNGLCVPP
jgi:hypothetical protein